MLLVPKFRDDGPDCWVDEVPEEKGSSLQEEVIEMIHEVDNQPYQPNHQTINLNHINLTYPRALIM